MWTKKKKYIHNKKKETLIIIIIIKRVHIYIYKEILLIIKE